MENENEVEQDTLNTANEDTTSENTETTEETTDTTEETQEESVEELKARLAKAEEIAKNQRIRAEKAEKAVKPEKKQEVSTDYKMTDEDFLAVIENKVPRQYLGEVKEYAQLKKISLAKALETPLMKIHLKNLAETDQTAQAANVKRSARGTGKVSGDSLLDKALSSGTLPDSDDDMRALSIARLQAKLGRK